MRLKNDVSQYAECVQSLGIPELTSKFATLQSLTNIFIVAPESLPELLHSTLALPPKDAITYLQQREDFKTARVNGQTLQQLFGGGGA